MVALGVPLGVGLGVGIPVLAALIASVVYYLQRQKRSREEVYPSQPDYGVVETGIADSGAGTPGRPSDVTLSTAMRGFPAAQRPSYTRASMASQQSTTSSYFDPFEFERNEFSAPDLTSEVNSELKARASTIRLAAIEEAPNAAPAENGLKSSGVESHGQNDDHNTSQHRA